MTEGRIATAVSKFKTKTSCSTCKELGILCDERKPTCQNCISSHRICEGYDIVFSFGTLAQSPVKGKQGSTMVNGKITKPGRKKSATEVDTNLVKDYLKSDNFIPVPFPPAIDLTPKDHSSKPSSISTEDSPGDVFLSPSKPKVLASMIPEVDLFQKVEAGSVLTPHLLLAQRRLKSSNPLDYKVSMAKQWQNIISPSPMSPPNESEILKENWNEVLKYMATPTNDEVDETSNFKHTTSTNDQTVNHSLEDYRNFTIDPWSIFKEYLPSETNISNKMTLPMKYIFSKILPLVNPDRYQTGTTTTNESKYYNSKIASSCFLSLSCLHVTQSINEIGAKEEFLRRSAMNINKSLEYLMDFIKENDLLENLLSNEVKNDQNLLFDIQKVVSNLKNECCNINEFRNVVLILSTLMHVQICYGIVENGRSALSRVFLKLFSLLAQNKDFKDALDEIDQFGYLVVSMSIWDTLSAITSPDCRIPFSSPSWYEFKDPNFSTEMFCGCPADLFICLSKVCHLRNSIKYDTIKRYDSMQMFDEINKEILNYRAYVTYDLKADYDNDEGESGSMTVDERFLTDISTAQLWSLAISAKILQIVKPFKNYKQMIHRLTLEFFDVYSRLCLEVSSVRSIVWPLMEISVGCETVEEKTKMMKFLNNLFQRTNSMNLRTIMNLVQRSWENDVVIEDILMGKEWLQAGIDLMPI